MNASCLVFQLFDTENYVNKHSAQFVFTTEGHLFPIAAQYRQKSWEKEGIYSQSLEDTDRLGNFSSNVSIQQ